MFIPRRLTANTGNARIKTVFSNTQRWAVRATQNENC